MASYSHSKQPPANPETRYSLELDTTAPMATHKREENAVATRLGSGVKDHGEGAFLTWEDLWVTVPNGKGGTRPILQGITGYARPGELLAIMGPSGCGKSTLLDALAGNNMLYLQINKFLCRMR